MELKPRSPYLPHHSFTIKNVSPNIKHLRLSETKIGLQQQEAADAAAKKYHVPTTELNVSDDINYDYLEQIVYKIKPGEALTFIFEGSLVPPTEFEEDLLYAITIDKYNLHVPALTIMLEFEYTTPDTADQWERNFTKQGRLWFQIISSYTAQRVPCSFKYNITVTEEEEEHHRCCLIHVPHYNQDEYVYFPHNRPFPSSARKTCECCD